MECFVCFFQQDWIATGELFSYYGIIDMYKMFPMHTCSRFSFVAMYLPKIHRTLHLVLYLIVHFCLFTHTILNESDVCFLKIYFRVTLLYQVTQFQVSLVLFLSGYFFLVKLILKSVKNSQYILGNTLHSVKCVF